jgi:hypothetical protein
MTPTREGSAAYHPPPEALPSQEWHGNEWRCESAKDWSLQIKLWLIMANQAVAGRGESGERAAGGETLLMANR